jgi:pyruvate/2-oxoglutarate dehydrogenase complex dihydrolipoamide acyltransferase (E2) component
MKIIEIKVDEVLWSNSMLPEGVVAKWLVADGGPAREGHGLAEVRIEGALHDVIAPRDGRLKIEVAVNDVIEPGSLLATLASI